MRGLQSREGGFNKKGGSQNGTSCTAMSRAFCSMRAWKVLQGAFSIFLFPYSFFFRNALPASLLAGSFFCGMSENFLSFFSSCSLSLFVHRARYQTSGRTYEEETAGLYPVFFFFPSFFLFFFHLFL